MNKFGTLSLDEAIKIVNEYDSMTKEEFEEKVFAQWNKEEINTDGLSQYDIFVRNEIKQVFDKYYPEACENRNKLYLLDLNVGLKIFELLRPGEEEFSVSDAANDDMWRYISVKIIPDLTNLRYPAKMEQGSKNINKKRFYSGTRRIWIKTLWWYVFLSWQGDSSKTYEVLKDNLVDNINKLIETPGKGYRLSVYRALMLEYSSRQSKAKYFAGVTKLNNVKCKTIEPSLLVGGEEKYAKTLFDEVPISIGQEEENDDSEE
jgi:hypothetical protein